MPPLHGGLIVLDDGADARVYVYHTAGSAKNYTGWLTAVRVT